MPGIRNMQIGAAFFVGGGLLTMASHSMTQAPIVFTFYGAIVFGALQLIVGFFQWISYAGKSEVEKTAHDMSTDLNLVLRSMISVAATDDHLDEGEVTMIEVISGSLLGESIPRDNIKQAFTNMKGQDFIGEVTRISRDVSPAGAELAIKGAIWVGRADGSLGEDEVRHIAAIASALNVSGTRLRDLIAEADIVFDKIVSPSHDSAQVR